VTWRVSARFVLEPGTRNQGGFEKRPEPILIERAAVIEAIIAWVARSRRFSGNGRARSSDPLRPPMHNV
jgi:hypothetical protein